MEEANNTGKNRKKGFSLQGFQLLRLAGIVLVIIILSRADLGLLWSYMKEIHGGFLALAIVFQLLVLFSLADEDDPVSLPHDATVFEVKHIYDRRMRQQQVVVMVCQRVRDPA